MKRAHRMPFGACLLAGGGARFRLWAPSACAVALSYRGACDPERLRIELPMPAIGEGWFELSLPQARPGDRYAFRIDGELLVPDPASRWNPDDVHAASVLVDPTAFDWTDDAWRGRPWHEAVLYELHVGCFTPPGSFAAAIAQLDDLVALGVTAIELMPVAEFPGRCNWGYDGVLLFAPEASYGSPQDLKRLVNAAHERGLMVLLDVVYNHFGPDGNYLHVYAKTFFDQARHTPWGAAMNLEGPGSETVRDFFIHNALYWLEEFHLDGLRLDAVHAIDDGPRAAFLDRLARAVREGPGRARHVHLVLENHLNEARFLMRAEAGNAADATVATEAHAAGAADEVPIAAAQWNDDVHHALHVLATGDTDGYYSDYADEPHRMLGRALAQGFAFQGEPSHYHGDVPRGTPAQGLSPLALVNAAQTHDQVGNRACGDRIATQAAAAGREPALRALIACLLLSPSPPMLFMGEEYAAATPFLYFCDFHGELRDAVTRGRRNEFARFAQFSDPRSRLLIPDPNEAATFGRSKLDWSQRAQPGHAQWLALYRRLLALRHRHLVPRLPEVAGGLYRLPAPGLLAVDWPLGQRARWQLLTNLSDRPAPVPIVPAGAVVYEGHPGIDQADHTVRVDQQDRGDRAAAACGDVMPAWSVRVSLTL